MIVYIVTNKIDGKQYVGQHCGDNLAKYWKRNVREAMRGYKGKRYLYRAMRSDGPENFEIKPLVIVGTKWEMDYYEKGLIKAFNTKAPNGYNLTDGGEGIPGLVKTEEHKRKIGIANLGKHSALGAVRSEEEKQHLSVLRMGEKNPNFGKHRPHTEEEKKKMSIASTGRRHSEETKIKISQSKKGIPISEETRRKREATDYYAISEETRKKMSESQKARQEQIRQSKNLTLFPHL